MAGPLRHDFMRTMKSKSVVLSMAAIILLSFALVPLIGIAANPISSSSGGTTVFTYYSGSEYRFSAYSFNSYGQPVIGTRVSANISDTAGVHPSAAITNASGFADWSLQAESPGTQVTYSVAAGNGFGSQGMFPPGMKTGEVLTIGGSPISIVVDSANSSRRVVLFVYQGPNGTRPSGYNVYYSYGSSSTGGQVFNVTRMSLLGAASSYVNDFLMPQAPKNATTVSVGAFESNPPYDLVSGFTAQTIGGSLTPPSPSAIFSSFSTTVLALVVPLMATMVAYNSYGKDRATGILESVLARPVTRRSLGLSRYLAFVIASSVALVVTTAIVETISVVLLGGAPPVTFAVYTAGALIIEAAAFTGIVMLLSQLTKSQGNLMLASVGLWIALDFFWSIVVFFASAVLGVQIGSGNYLALTIQSSFLNPAQFYSLVGVFLNGVAISTGIGGSTPISPATYGLTPFTLVLTGAFWILAPLLGFIYLVERRD